MNKQSFLNAILFLFLMCALHSASKKLTSNKRGVAFNISSIKDMDALALGASWFHNWSPYPSNELMASFRDTYDIEFVPMLWNFDFDHNAVVSYMKNHSIKHFLVLNEPNVFEQANLDPDTAAELWPKYEAVANETGAKIVGPQMTWGTTKFEDPLDWLDKFFSSYRKLYGKDAQVYALGFHWFDYGLGAQLDRLRKYDKPIWVTEFANWHVGLRKRQVDSADMQREQMYRIVLEMERREEVERYAWFTGRWEYEGDWHHTSLLAAEGALSDLGAAYNDAKSSQDASDDELAEYLGDSQCSEYGQCWANQWEIRDKYCGHLARLGPGGEDTRHSFAHPQGWGGTRCFCCPKATAEVPLHDRR